jgi:membrane protein required for colicin V production
MNGVDVVLVVILAGCALRGWWRGFFRECFGLMALVLGIAAALRFTAAGDAALQPHVHLPAPVAAGVAFVVIFVVVNSLINVVGVLLNRLAQTAAMSLISGVGGALLGAGKGVVVLAFVLLFLHLFPVGTALDQRVMGSSIARPLVGIASNAIRIGAPADPANRI